MYPAHGTALALYLPLREAPVGILVVAVGTRIHFYNISATSENGCFIGADEVGKVDGITFDNVHIMLDGAKADRYVFDKRPCKGEGFVTVGAKELQNANAPVVTENASFTVD